MRGVEADGADHRNHFLIDVFFHPLGLLGGPLPAAQKADVLSGQSRYQHLIEGGVLLLDFIEAYLRDFLQHLGGLHAVGSGCLALQLDALLQSGDADFEEFVQVGAENQQEFEALQQRVVFVQSLGQHPLIELQVAQLAVDIVVGVVQCEALIAECLTA